MLTRSKILLAAALLVSTGATAIAGPGKYTNTSRQVKYTKTLHAKTFSPAAEESRGSTVLGSPFSADTQRWWDRATGAGY